MIFNILSNVILHFILNSTSPRFVAPNDFSSSPAGLPTILPSPLAPSLRSSLNFRSWSSWRRISSTGTRPFSETTSASSFLSPEKRQTRWRHCGWLARCLSLSICRLCPSLSLGPFWNPIPHQRLSPLLFLLNWLLIHSMAVGTTFLYRNLQQWKRAL